MRRLTLLDKERILYRLNVAGAILHGSSFIAALVVSIIFASNSFQTELTTDFQRNRVSTVESLGTYSIIWVDLPFPIITAMFHAIIAFVPSVWEQYKKDILLSKTPGNYLRWLEYSITASLMTWVIMQLSGITNIFALIVIGVIGNIALQCQGYLQELLKNVSWIPTLVGWIIFMGQWSTIMTYFFINITSETGGVPWFVYSIIIGLFFLFSMFGFIQLSYLVQYPKFMKTAFAQEVAYLIMSLTAKLFLTWNLLIGIAVNPRT